MADKKMDFMTFFKGRDTSKLTKEVNLKSIPFPFIISAVSKDQFNEYTKLAKGDGQKVLEALVINHTVEPNFKNADMIKQFGVNTPSELLDKIFLAGEFYELANQITAFSEFDVDMNQKVQQAKN